MSQPGLGYMINELFGYGKGTSEALDAAQNKKILSAQLHEPKEHTDGVLDVRFTDGTGIRFLDCARSCCESRYLRTDDDLASFAGAEFRGAELRDGGTQEDQWGEPTEIMFLLVHTSEGDITVSSHNNHNGYYGGIQLTVQSLPTVWP